MSYRKALFLLLVVPMLVVATPAAEAQAAKPAAATVSNALEGGVPRYIKPETPEERRARVGTAEDPGIDPDPETIFWRFGKPFTIYKVEKEFAKYMDQPGWVRPLAQANFIREIYQENDKYIWVWTEVRDPEAEKKIEPEKSPWDDAAVKYFQELRSDFTPIDVPDAGVRVRFEEASKGLPTTGSWRNGAAVADMNNDGKADLVFPPQRGQAAAPTIFLGDGKGGWSVWPIEWPRPFNYGSVVVADFNKDKKLDLAFSVHLTGVALFLGDGKGKFREVTEGLPKDFPTRRLVAADVDADGWMDIVAISEGPVGRGRDAQNKMNGGIRAYLNRNKGRAWEGMNVAEPREYLGGDYLSSGNFNGDRYPDFVGANVYFNSTHTLFLSKNAPDYDSAAKGILIPGRSYYHATAAGRFLRNAKTDDFIVSYVRHWPTNLDANLVATPPLQKVTGIDRLTFVDGETQRVPIVRWEGARRTNGMAAGDVDGDGNLDLLYTETASQEIKLLLGKGDGTFVRGEVPGLKLEPQRTYDLQLADLDGDKRLDVLISYESDETTAFADKNGSIHVFLNRGPEQQ